MNLDIPLGFSILQHWGPDVPQLHLQWWCSACSGGWHWWDQAIYGEYKEKQYGQGVLRTSMPYLLRSFHWLCSFSKARQNCFRSLVPLGPSQNPTQPVGPQTPEVCDSKLTDAITTIRGEVMFFKEPVRQFFFAFCICDNVGLTTMGLYGLLLCYTYYLLHLFI